MARQIFKGLTFKFESGFGETGLERTPVKLCPLNSTTFGYTTFVEIEYLFRNMFCLTSSTMLKVTKYSVWCRVTYSNFWGRDWQMYKNMKVTKNSKTSDILTV